MADDNEQFIITQDLLNQHDNWKQFFLFQDPDGTIKADIFVSLSDPLITDQAGDTWFHYIFRCGDCISVFDAFGQYGLQEERDYGIKNKSGELAAEVILQNDNLEPEQKVLYHAILSGKPARAVMTLLDNSEYEYELPEPEFEIPNIGVKSTLLTRCVQEIKRQNLSATANKQKDDPAIAEICIDLIKQSDSIKELGQLLDGIGVSFGDKPGLNGTLAPLRYRSKNLVKSLWNNANMGYRETNDTHKIAQAAFKRAHELNCDNEHVEACQKLLDRGSRRIFPAVDRNIRTVKFSIKKRLG